MSREFHGNADALTNEQKILFVNAWDLLEKTRERSSKVRGMDMTWRLQLRGDCSNLEKALRAAEKSPGPAEFKKVETAYICLKTSAENILSAEED